MKARKRKKELVWYFFSRALFDQKMNSRRVRGCQISIAEEKEKKTKHKGKKEICHE